MNAASHRIADKVRSVVAYWSPTPKHSQFVDKGTLTPQEFVDAGDQLVFKFPSWKWETADSRRQVAWLPTDKQYLITRNVPCKSRVRDLDSQFSINERVETDGWLIHGHEEDAEETLHEISDISNAPCESNDAPKANQVFDVRNEYLEGIQEQDAAEAPPDISSLNNVEDLLEKEEDAAAVEPTYFVRNPPDADIVRTRTYDLSITYDKYYQTPRLWLFGYDENGIPLTSTQVFEDILTEYASKTVTIDPHPSTGVPTASIHPCNHAYVMKKIVASWIERGLEPRHDLSLLMLLKFISSVIPTIDYDFTMGVDLFSMDPC